jgi:hypothetical protein
MIRGLEGSAEPEIEVRMKSRSGGKRGLVEIEVRMEIELRWKSRSGGN